MDENNLTTLAKRLRPFVKMTVQDVIPEIPYDHGALTGLGDDDHPQYMSTSVDKTITGLLTFSPSVARAPFNLGSNAQGQTVTGLRADQLNKSISASGLGLSGGGLLTSNQTITLASSSSPGVAASILATDASGFLDLVRLTAVGVPDTYEVPLEITTHDELPYAIYLRNGSYGSGYSKGLGLWQTNVGDIEFDSEGLTTITLTPSQNVGIPTAAADVRLNVAGMNSAIRATIPDGNSKWLFMGNNLTWGSTQAKSFSIWMGDDGYTGMDSNGHNTIGLTPEGYLGCAVLSDLWGYENIAVNPCHFTTGGALLPMINYKTGLGTINKKWLMIHAAELWVETLVAQDTIATIGGRILVGSTTTLVDDLASGNNWFYTKHNNLTVNDIVYLESDGKVEWIRIVGGPAWEPSLNGWWYSITRNLDGSGANDWFAGDAVFNTGITGNGYIDLYSVDSIRSGTQYGPTIVGNVRTGSTYSDLIECWAIGNLNGLYGYATNDYGVGFGKFAAGNQIINITPVDGIWMGTYNGASSWTARIVISAAGILSISNSSGNPVFTFDASSGAEFTLPLTLGTSGGIYQGSGTFGSPTTGLKIYNSSGVGKISGYNAGVEQWMADTDGKLKAGGGNVIMDDEGIELASITNYDPYPPTTGAIIWWNDGSGNRAVTMTNQAYSGGGRWYEIFDIIKPFSSSGGFAGKSIRISTRAQDNSDYAELTIGKQLYPSAATYIRAFALSPGSSTTFGVYSFGAFLSGGSFHYSTDLVAQRNSTDYTGYIYVPLANPVDVWAGTWFSTTGSGNYKTNSNLGVPSGAKAVNLSIVILDNQGTWGGGNYMFSIGPTDSYYYQFEVYCWGASRWVSSTGIVNMVSDKVYYRCTTSGTSSMQVYCRCWGYLI